MVQILAYVGGTSKNPYFASTSSNPIAQAAANGTLQPGPTTNYGPAAVISFGGNDVTLAPSTYSALGAGGGVITADQAYIQANSDVAAAIASGQFRNGLEHYLIYGAREGRFYAGVGQQTFSAEQLYLEENPDVAGAIQSGMFRSGLEHYLLNGASEGRYYYGQSTRSITPEELYLRDNQDVANAVRSGVYSSGLDHFNRYGRAEGRFYYGYSQGPAQNIFVQTVQTTRNGATITLTPDQQYLMANPAAAQAVASGRYRDGLQYFLNEGYASGSNYRNIQAWRLNNSAERSYLQAHADVAEAVAAGVSPSGEEHFFTYGKNEAFRGGYGQLSNATYNANTIDGAYLRANRDAALALANGQYATGLDYFLAVGAGRGQSYGKITAAGLNTVGERQYLAANRDVANAIAAGLYYSSGLEHFLATGYTEGRNYGNLTAASLTSGPSATLDRLYLQAHPEAAAALANGQFGSAFAYFATLGADRGDSYGRLTAATLGDANERTYLISNKDVAAAVATGGYANGLDHFIYGGYAEGRGDYGNLRAASLTDPSLGSLEVAYLQQNKDVARAVAGGQYSSGLAHFLTVGGSEGRHYGALQASQSLGSSPEAVYIVQNADVAAAIAKGQASSGLDYFLKTGIDKGHSYGRLSAATLGGANDPERQYLTRFQDVAKAVADGVHASGLAHYLSYGYRDRLGINYGNLTAEMLNPNFLEGQYLQSHIGAANAVARGSAKNGIDYFLNTGIDQGDSYGKLSGASVGALGQAERAYLAQNLDVARNVAGPNGYTSGLVHYLTSGYVEANRTGYGALNSQTYKPGTAEFKYLLANQDAAQAVANGQYASGFDYFAAVGAGKGQAYGKLAGADFAAASPAERDYLLKNRDVANAVGLGVYPNGLDHFLRNGRTEGRSYGQLRAETLQGTTGSNPELAYLLANRDVAAAVAAGTYASGLAHYFSYGRAEGRQGYGTVSSEVLNATGLDSEYLRANPLALQAVASGQAKSGLDYFLKVGIDQGERYGRLTAASLAAVGPSERGYLSKNLDVAKAVADGVYASGFDHYTAIGYTEANRGQYGALRTDFYAKNDAQGAYLRANKDAAKAVADGLAVTAMDYFLRTGVDKGQSFGSLSAATLGAAGSPERAYLTQHQDVAASVVAGTFASGLDHYLRSGYVDPRRASGYGRLNAQGANPTFIFGSVDGKYLRANLDAAAAVAAGTAASGLDYFLSTGIQKGQSYGTLTTATVGSKDGAEYAYLKAHADVAQLVATGQAKSGLLYFLTSGVEQGHSYGAIAAGKLGGKTDPERKYLTRYLDVAAAVASGFYGSGLVHYLTGGKAEGRIYEGSAGATLQPVAIDPTSRDSWYLVSHDAAFMAVAKGEAKNGLDYFLKVGIDKGDTYGMLTRERFGDASSLERQYLARNLDVAAAVAEGTYINGLAHYLAYGYKEADRGGFGRLDPNKLGGSALGDAERKYLQANLDVGQAIADGRYQGDGLQHYLTWGYKESNRGSYGGLKDDVEFKTTNANNEATYLLGRRSLAEEIASGKTSDTGLTYFVKNELKTGAYGGFRKNDRSGDSDERMYLIDHTDVARDIALGVKSNGFQDFVGRVQQDNNLVYGVITFDDIRAKISQAFNGFMSEINRLVGRDERDIIAGMADLSKNEFNETAQEVLRDLMGIKEFRDLWDQATVALGGTAPFVEFGLTSPLITDINRPPAAVDIFTGKITLDISNFGAPARASVVFETMNIITRDLSIDARIQAKTPGKMTRQEYIDTITKIEYQNLPAVKSLIDANPDMFPPDLDFYDAYFKDGKLISWDNFKEIFHNSDYGKMHAEKYGKQYDNYTKATQYAITHNISFVGKTYSEIMNFVDGHTIDFSKLDAATAAAVAELIGDRNLSELAKKQLNDLGIHSWPEFGAWRGDGASPGTSTSSGWGETSELGSTETAGNPPGDR